MTETTERTPPRLVLAVAALFTLLVATAPGARGQAPEPPPACAESPAYSKLDFWVGEWEVFSGGEKVGDNRIEKIIGGCALLEHWTGVEGGRGRSLFYHLPAEGVWKQVWITETATRPGGTKEKRLVEESAGGGLVFRGEIALPGGGTYRDQTTLRPLPGGEVGQVIAISRDGGASWETVFDAVYRRAAEPSDDVARLLELHREAIDAHLRRDVAGIMAAEAPDAVVASHGEMKRPSLEERRAMFAAYFESTEFTTYRDVVEPVVEVSDDGTLGWVIAEVEVEAVSRGADGARSDVDFKSSWIELYEKRDGRWLRIGNVSNIAPR